MPPGTTGWAQTVSQGLTRGFLLLVCGSGRGLLPSAEMILPEKSASVFSFLKLFGNIGFELEDLSLITEW